MENTRPEGPVADEVRETLERLGYSLVEFAAEVVKGRMHVHCVLHHPDGIGLDRLSEVHRGLQPRLEMLLDSRDLYIEFSSPGVDRRIKSFHEFTIFEGRRVAIMRDREWIEGTIQHADDSTLEIAFDGGGRERYSSREIHKARLLE